MGSSFSFLLVRWNRIVQDVFVLLLKKDPEKKFAVLQQQRLFLFDARSNCFFVSQECRLFVNEEPRSRAAEGSIVRSYSFHIRSLTPQQAARNALAIRFNRITLQGKISVYVFCAFLTQSSPSFHTPFLQSAFSLL